MRSLLLVLPLLLGPLAPGPVVAEPAAAPAMRLAGDIGPAKAAAVARKATGGKVLGVRAARADGRTVYRVKLLLPGGRVRVVTVDAQSGQLG